MWGSLLGGVASTLAGGLMNKFLPGASGATSPGGGLFASDADTVGIQSATAGTTPGAPSGSPSFMESALEGLKGLGGTAAKGLTDAGNDAVSSGIKSMLSPKAKSATSKGEDTRAYLQAAFPELNPWERSGAGASSAGMVDAGFENQKQLTKMQLDNNLEIARMNNDTSKDIAGLQSSTSIANTKATTYANNEMLPFNKRESMARVENIMANSALSSEQKTTQITQQLLNAASTANAHLTSSQIAAMTDKVRAEVKLTEQNTSLSKENTYNARYGSSQVGKTAKDVSNVLGDTGRAIGNGASFIVDELNKYGNYLNDKLNIHSKSTGVHSVTK